MKITERNISSGISLSLKEKGERGVRKLKESLRVMDKRDGEVKQKRMKEKS